MCYTLHASAWAFFVNLATSAVLAYFNPVLGWFYMYVGLMQLYDMIFWMNQRENRVNFWVTKLAMITNNLQPVVLAALIYFVGKRKLQRVTLIALVAYVVSMTVYSASAYAQIDYTLVSPESTPSLNWQWNYLPYSTFVYGMYLVATILLLYDGFERPLNYILIGVCLLSFFLSMYYYKGKTSTGRFWCYFSSYVPILLVAYILFSRTNGADKRSRGDTSVL